MAVYYHDSLYTSGQRPGLMHDKKLLFVIGGGLLVVAISLILLAISNGPGAKEELGRLSARYNSTIRFIAENREQVKGGDLRKISSEANLLLASDSTAFSTLLTKKFGVKQASAEIVASEADTTSKAALTQAAQAGNFEATYKKLLYDKLVNCAAQIKVVAQQVQSNELKAALSQAQSDLESVGGQLSKLP